MNLNSRLSNTWHRFLWRRKNYARSYSLLRTTTRFYENASYTENEGSFYIQLDGKTIKTPLKNKLYAPTKQLASAVVSEWSLQQSHVKPHQMHLTALCNTCIDNPENLSKASMIHNMLAYLHSDTLCARIPQVESEVMSKLQEQKWNPIIDWFSNRFSVEVHSSTEIFGLEQPKQTIQKLKNFLFSMNDWQLTGLRFSIDTLKSFIIPLAVIEKHLSVEDAVYLARLEVQMQMEKWGNVEWYHEVEQANQMALLSAGTLFFRLCSQLKY